NQAHALRVASVHGDIGNGGTNQRAGIRNQHDFIVVGDKLGANHSAVTFVRLNGNHALAATSLQRIFVRRRALAIAVLGGGKNVPVADDDEVGHAFAFRKTNAAHTGSGATHRAHVFFVE